MKGTFILCLIEPKRKIRLDEIENVVRSGSGNYYLIEQREDEGFTKKELKKAVDNSKGFLGIARKKIELARVYGPDSLYVRIFKELTKTKGNFSLVQAYGGESSNF